MSPTLAEWWQDLLKLLIFEKQCKQGTEGDFSFTACHSNEKNLDHISCNVPRLNVTYLALETGQAET